MMTFKQAKAYLEAGKPFKAMCKAGEYTFRYIEDKYIYDNKKEFGYWEEEGFNNANFQFISFLPRKQFKVGDKVIITDDIKETNNWNIYKEDFKDMKGKITDYDYSICGKCFEINNDYFIGEQFLVADYEEEVKEMTINRRSI